MRCGSPPVRGEATRPGRKASRSSFSARPVSGRPGATTSRASATGGPTWRQLGRPLRSPAPLRGSPLAIGVVALVVGVRFLSPSGLPVILSFRGIAEQLGFVGRFTLGAGGALTAGGTPPVRLSTALDPVVAFVWVVASHPTRLPRQVRTTATAHIRVRPQSLRHRGATASLRTLIMSRGSGARGLPRPGAPPRRSAPRLRPGPGDPGRPGRSRRPRANPPLAHVSVEDDPTAGVSVHGHDRPLSALDLPADSLAPRALRRGDPEPSPPPATRRAATADLVPGRVEVVDLGMRHPAQVGIDLVVGADAHEDGPPAGLLCPYPDTAQHVLRHDIGRAAAKVDVLGRQRVGRRRQTLGTGGVVAIRVARTRVGARLAPHRQAQTQARQAPRRCPAPRPPRDPQSSRSYACPAAGLDAQRLEESRS